MAQTAKEYASALFSLAMEEDLLDEIYASLTDAQTLFAQNPQYKLFLASRGIPKKERVQALFEALAHMPEYTRSFLAVLIDHDEIRHLDACVEAFAQMYQEQKRQVTAYVTSATALSNEQVQRLQERLVRQSGRAVNLVLTVDPSLLAGMRIDMDGAVFDGSLKRRLQNMKKGIGT